jgi:hypothetical protein
MPQTHTFQAILQRPDQPGAWTYLTVSLDVAEVFGTKAGFLFRAP